MIEVVIDTNGDKLVTLPNIDRRLAEEILTPYTRRGWFLENRDEVYQILYHSNTSHVTFKLRLPKMYQNLK
jgi:hypothetical protein